MKELESQFEEGRWLPFNKSIILQDEVNKVVPVSTTAGTWLLLSVIECFHVTSQSRENLRAAILVYNWMET